ncbi:hypothetical protein AB3Y40_06775 [Yoonia sp. R2331]|uniref:hypothetical protein n=1 Tax=Yoonia sp. R2331 TaxID=3237238 RepID=UPI0034E53DAA
MANSDTPFGLKPIRHRNGAAYNGAVNPYYVPAGYGTALFVGDPVVKTGTSNSTIVTAPGAGEFNVGALPAVNKAAAGDTNAITGVIVGFAPDPNGLERTYNPASTERVALVCDDPDVVFEIQADGAIAATQVGLNAVLIYTNSGDTGTGLSGAELDTTSDVPAATATNQLTIQRVVNREDNEAGSAFTKVEVKINNHTEAHGAVGI